MITLTPNFGIATIEPTRAWGDDAVLTTQQPTLWAQYEDMQTQHPYWFAFWRVYRTAAVGLCAYHGYKRNDSVGGALGWGVLALIFPTLTSAVAVAQGVSKPAR